MTQSRRSDSIAALVTFVEGLLGRALTQDEAEQLLAFLRKATYDVLIAMQKQVRENPEAFQ